MKRPRERAFSADLVSDERKQRIELDGALMARRKLGIAQHGEGRIAVALRVQSARQLQVAERLLFLTLPLLC
jgi:hypothetical protein